jgi:hypothetical protein
LRIASVENMEAVKIKQSEKVIVEREFGMNSLWGILDKRMHTSSGYWGQEEEYAVRVYFKRLGLSRQSIRILCLEKQKDFYIFLNNY